MMCANFGFGTQAMRLARPQTPRPITKSLALLLPDHSHIVVHLQERTKAPRERRGAT
jgi:hypothetical protein